MGLPNISSVINVSFKWYLVIRILRGRPVNEERDDAGGETKVGPSDAARLLLRNGDGE